MPDIVKDFLGSGWKFPPRLDARGRVELVHQERDIEEAIKMILLTPKGERPMRPGFGSELHTLLYQPNDASTCGLARRYVREALAMWEPRIAVIDVTAEPDRDPHTNNGTEQHDHRHPLPASRDEQRAQPCVPLLHDPRRGIAHVPARPRPRQP